MQAEVSRGATAGVAGVINTSSSGVGKVNDMKSRNDAANAAKKSAEALDKLSAGGGNGGGADSAPPLGDNTGGGGNNGGDGESGGGKGGGNQVHSADSGAKGKSGGE